jgi:hypothetical protein
VQQVIYTLSSNSFSFFLLSKAKILETQVPLQTFDTCLSAYFWFRLNFRFTAFVHLTEDSMLPSSILASRLIFGFGLTFALQLSFTSPRIRCYPLRYSPLGLFLVSVQLSLYSFVNLTEVRYYPLRYSPYGLLSGLD